MEGLYPTIQPEILQKALAHANQQFTSSRPAFLQAIQDAMKGREVMGRTELTLPKTDEEALAQLEDFLKGQIPQALDENGGVTFLSRTHTTAWMDSSNSFTGAILRVDPEVTQVLGYCNHYYSPSLSEANLGLDRSAPNEKHTAYNDHFWGTMNVDTEGNRAYAKPVSGLAMKLYIEGENVTKTTWGFQLSEGEKSAFVPFSEVR